MGLFDAHFVFEVDSLSPSGELMRCDQPRDGSLQHGGNVSTVEDDGSGSLTLPDSLEESW